MCAHVEWCVCARVEYCAGAEQAEAGTILCPAVFGLSPCVQA